MRRVLFQENNQYRSIEILPNAKWIYCYQQQVNLPIKILHIHQYFLLFQSNLLITISTCINEHVIQYNHICSYLMLWIAQKASYFLLDKLNSL